MNARNEQVGPVPGEQLPQYGVSGSTKVWTNGMAQWIPAMNVPELAPLFTPQGGSVPPPPPPKPQASAQKPDNLLVWSILATLLCCLPLGIVAIIYSNKVDPLWNEGRFEEAEKAAASAKMYCFISAGFGVLSAIVGFFMILLGAL